MLFITQRLQAYFLKITGRWPPFTSMHCCTRVWKLYTRLRKSSSIAATSSTMACEFLNSHDTPLEHTVFQEPPQEKVWYSEVCRPSRPNDVAETRHFTNNSHTVSYHMKWRPLLYCSPWRQPRQAIAPAQFSNSKCVSRLRATLYKRLTLYGEGCEPLVVTSKLSYKARAGEAEAIALLLPIQSIGLSVTTCIEIRARWEFPESAFDCELSCWYSMSAILWTERCNSLITRSIG